MWRFSSSSFPFWKPNKHNYSLMTRLNICSLPAEPLRIIAMNLDFENLVCFQKSRSVDLAARSDISFYYSFFEEHYVYRAIDKLYLYKGEVINWKSVAELFLKNHHSFAEFFHTNAYNKLKHPELYFEPSKEFEL
jgi:hypothetical protein